jgi:hypothetical protein
LTGVRAGERDLEGRYPEGSVNERVEQKLRQFIERQKKVAAAINQRYLGAPED